MFDGTNGTLRDGDGDVIHCRINPSRIQQVRSSYWFKDYVPTKKVIVEENDDDNEIEWWWDENQEGKEKKKKNKKKKRAVCKKMYLFLEFLFLILCYCL